MSEFSEIDRIEDICAKQAETITELRDALARETRWYEAQCLVMKEKQDRLAILEAQLVAVTAESSRLRNNESDLSVLVNSYLTPLNATWKDGSTVLNAPLDAQVRWLGEQLVHRIEDIVELWAERDSLRTALRQVAEAAHRYRDSWTKLGTLHRFTPEHMHQQMVADESSRELEAALALPAVQAVLHEK